METQSKVCVTVEVVIYARHQAKIIGRGRCQFGPCHRRPTGLQRVRAPTGRRLLDVLGSSLPCCVFLFVLLAAVLSLALSKLLPAFAVAEREKGRGDQRFVFHRQSQMAISPFSCRQRHNRIAGLLQCKHWQLCKEEASKENIYFSEQQTLKKERFFFSFFMQSSFAIKLVMQR